MLNEPRGENQVSIFNMAFFFLSILIDSEKTSNSHTHVWQVGVYKIDTVCARCLAVGLHLLCSLIHGGFLVDTIKRYIAKMV